MTDIKDTVRAGEIVKALREMLPPKEDYAELVCAEGWAHGQHYVWTDPEPYHIEAAIALIESLQAQLAESRRREKDEDEYCHGNECVKRVTDWLQQPAETEGTE